ncbi:hypothetical protein [Ruegeria atlantica]|uniref:hypothetical protein n=1 Tax=Ruegeria atlantica TaxID=81569 RepID=UPI0020C24D1D|nr:hypothetical protein [Ruegeria atlantica]
MLMTRMALVFLLCAAPAAADVIGPGGKVQDCYCTDKSGTRVELGEMICLQVDGRMFTAQCQMSLNVPMWREVQEGCLSSELQTGQPPINTISIYPEITPAKS